MKSAGFDSHIFQQVFKQCKFSTGIIITFQVMAVARMSPGDPHTVRPVTQGCKDQFWAYPGRARDPDNPEIRGILESAYTSQIGCTITTPVT
jgi:hypothetical protein